MPSGRDLGRNLRAMCLTFWMFDSRLRAAGQPSNIGTAGDIKSGQEAFEARLEKFGDSRRLSKS